MPAKTIDGKEAARKLRERVAAAVLEFKSATGRVPGLAVVLVGEDPASEVYVASKGRATREAGMISQEFRLAADAPEAELLALVGRLNEDAVVDGILVQLPLPAHMSEDAVFAAIDPAKDVDGFHAVNAGRLAAGTPGFVPCTPLGCQMLLKQALGELDGLSAVVIGRSNIVGKPMALLLLRENCTVTIAHSRTPNLAEVVRRADIVVAAVGRPELVRGEWIKPGAAVIDVGINRVASGEPGKSRLVGDVDFRGASANAAFVTPVPGGVGPMTIACLLRNTVIAACSREGVEAPADL